MRQALSPINIEADMSRSACRLIDTIQSQPVVASFGSVCSHTALGRCWASPRSLRRAWSIRNCTGLNETGCTGLNFTGKVWSGSKWSELEQGQVQPYHYEVLLSQIPSLMLVSSSQTRCTETPSQRWGIESHISSSLTVTDVSAPVRSRSLDYQDAAVALGISLGPVLGWPMDTLWSYTLNSFSGCLYWDIDPMYVYVYVYVRMSVCLPIFTDLVCCLVSTDLMSGWVSA